MELWFSVVCTLIDNDTRQHSGQNLLWTHSTTLITVMRNVSFLLLPHFDVIGDLLRNRRSGQYGIYLLNTYAQFIICSYCATGRIRL